MTEHLHERRPMSTSAFVSVAGLALAVVVALGGVIAEYGAWSRSEGARESFEREAGKRIAALEARVEDLSVLRYKVQEAHDAANGAVSELRMKEQNDHDREVRELTAAAGRK